MNDAFLLHATAREVLGFMLPVAGLEPVARLEDVFQGKIWAALDPTRRGNKRQKDLADIARLLEAHPDLRDRVPVEILARLIWRLPVAAASAVRSCGDPCPSLAMPVTGSQKPR